MICSVLTVSQGSEATEIIPTQRNFQIHFLYVQSDSFECLWLDCPKALWPFKTCPAGGRTTVSCLLIPVSCRKVYSVKTTKCFWLLQFNLLNARTAISLSIPSPVIWQMFQVGETMHIISLTGKWILHWGKGGKMEQNTGFQIKPSRDRTWVRACWWNWCEKGASTRSAGCGFFH